MENQDIGEEVSNCFKVIEWKIKNFCLWDPKIHEKYLKDCSCDIELFPAGLHGDGEHLVARVYDEGSSSVEISFIGSDGSLLSLLEIKQPEWKEGCEVLPPGPKFDKVVQARKKNPELKDILTLKCRLRKNKNSWFGSQTTLIALDVSLKVSSEMFQDIKIGEQNWISRIGGLPEDESCDTIAMLGVSADNDDDDDDYYDIDDGIEDDSYRSGELDLFTLITDSDHVTFILKPASALNNFKIHVSLSLLDKDNSITKCQQDDHIFRGMKEWMFSDLLNKSEVMKEENSIIIHLKVITEALRKKEKYSLSFDPSIEKIKPFPSGDAEKSICLNQPAPSVTILSKELMALYQDEDYADFQLHCGNVTFSTHRGILSARSTVLKSMLSSDMSETATGSMKITDLDVNTLGRFLSFLYSGIVEDLPWESALKLYYAADKYQVPSLKSECKTVLSSSVSISNVCNILLLADKHEDEELVSVTHDFILRNYYNVLKSKEWKSFMQSEPYLVSKTVTHLTTCLLEK